MNILKSPHLGTAIGMRIRSSYIWAMVIALGVVAWMVSDDFFGSDAEDGAQSTASEQIAQSDTDANMGSDSGAMDGATKGAMDDANTFVVSALVVTNDSIRRVIRANGISEPDYEVTVASKIDGSIVKVPTREGAQVKKGDVLVVLDEETLPAQIAASRAEVIAAETALNAALEQSRGTLDEELAAARANLEVAKKRLEISAKLAKQNFSAPLEQAELKADYENRRVALAKIEIAQNFRADIEVSQTTARLEAAKSNLAVLRARLDDSTIVAPTSGRLETIHVDVGERLGRDQPAATILGMDNLSVVVAVPQTTISRISLGDKVEVEIAGAGKRMGTVVRISSKSVTSTRTFGVEIAVPNEDGGLRAGVTVEAVIDIGEVRAFAMSPAHLSVAGDGSLTAKISDNGVVRIVPVEMVRSGVERVYVSGLQDGMILLTVGQAFFESGDAVKYVIGGDQ